MLSGRDSLFPWLSGRQGPEWYPVRSCPPALWRLENCTVALAPDAHTLSSPERGRHLLHMCGCRRPQAGQDAVPLHSYRREYPGHGARVHGPCGPWSQAGEPAPFRVFLFENRCAFSPVQFSIILNAGGYVCFLMSCEAGFFCFFVFKHPVTPWQSLGMHGEPFKGSLRASLCAS